MATTYSSHQVVLLSVPKAFPNGDCFGFDLRQAFFLRSFNAPLQAVSEVMMRVKTRTFLAILSGIMTTYVCVYNKVLNSIVYDVYTLYIYSSIRSIVVYTMYIIYVVYTMHMNNIPRPHNGLSYMCALCVRITYIHIFIYL